MDGRAWGWGHVWQYTVNRRFAAVPALELAHVFPGLRHVRGLRISASAGIVFNRDDMSGAYTGCPDAPPAAGLPSTYTYTLTLSPRRRSACTRFAAEATALVALREPERVTSAIDAVLARPAMKAMMTAEARTQRAAWVASRPTPPAPPRTAEEATQ